MARIKTFTNGGSFLPGDMNSIQDDYETAFSSYKHVHGAAYRFDAPGGATYLLVPGGAGAGVVNTGATAGLAVAYLDPAWFTAGSRSNLWRVQVACLVNATAPTVNFTTGLYPVSTPAGAAATLALTLGAVVTGSTAAVNAPGAGSSAHVDSGDFAAPAAGAYALATVISGAAAANSSTLIVARLQYRQV